MTAEIIAATVAIDGTTRSGSSRFMSAATKIGYGQRDDEITSLHASHVVNIDRCVGQEKDFLCRSWVVPDGVIATANSAGSPYDAIGPRLPA